MVTKENTASDCIRAFSNSSELCFPCCAADDLSWTPSSIRLAPQALGYLCRESAFYDGLEATGLVKLQQDFDDALAAGRDFSTAELELYEAMKQLSRLETEHQVAGVQQVKVPGTLAGVFDVCLICDLDHKQVVGGLKFIYRHVFGDANWQTSLDSSNLGA